MKIRFDLSLYILGAVTTFMLIGLMTPQVHAQTPSPLAEDQDGDGDALNEEKEISFDCSLDQDLVKDLAARFGVEQQVELTLSEDDCNFVMHYLSGQCEEQTAKGVNVTEVCNTTLSDYLESRDLLTKDFPTDTERFNAILDEFNQKRASAEQEAAQKEANTPSWAENLE